MRRTITTILLFLGFLSVRAQEETKEPEDYFAARLFKEKYKDTTYTELEQKNLLGWIGIDSLTNPGLKELVSLRESPTRRRFKFWQIRKETSNPIVWYVELTNANATAETEQSVFMEDAVLTFYAQGAMVL